MKFYYPSTLNDTSPDNSLPVIIYINPLDYSYEVYAKQLERLASWGFVTVGNNAKKNTGNGEQAIKILQTLKEWNSIHFKNKLNLDKVGLVGHLEGAVGAINSVIKSPNEFKALYILSPIQNEIIKKQKYPWEYDTSKIQTPTLMVSTDSPLDRIMYISADNFNNYFKAIPVKAISGVRKDKSSESMYLYETAYITIFFLEQLRTIEDKNVLTKDGDFGKNVNWTTAFNNY